MSATVTGQSTSGHQQIENAQCLVWSLEDDLCWLRDESMNWREWFAGTVSQSGSERDMQDRAIAECTAALEQAEKDLAALTAARNGESG